MNFFTRITSKLLRGPEMANFSEADGGGKKPEQDDKVNLCNDIQYGEKRC